MGDNAGTMQSGVYAVVILSGSTGLCRVFDVKPFGLVALGTTGRLQIISKAFTYRCQ